jgi:hypothetical protein
MLSRIESLKAALDCLYAANGHVNAAGMPNTGDKIRECHVAVTAQYNQELAKPELRPFTNAELWDRRDWWFREKSKRIFVRRFSSIELSPDEIMSTVFISGASMRIARQVLLHDWECCGPDGVWVPCGVIGG